MTVHLSDGHGRIDPIEEGQLALVLNMNVHPRALYLIDVWSFKPVELHCSALERFACLFGGLSIQNGYQALANQTA